jgi:uncharacterized membrane protein required for colicin V production
MGVLYQLIVVALLVYGCYRGYVRGITGQTDAMMGMAFGIVGALLLGKDLALYLAERYPATTEGVDPWFLPGTLATGIIYMLFYGIFMIPGGILRRIMSVFGKGVLNGIAGALVGLTKYAMAVSIAYNIIIGIDNESVLLKYANDNDGNLSEVVMLLSPALLGCESYDTLAHKIQMSEAAKISCFGGETFKIENEENNKYDVKGKRFAC